MNISIIEVVTKLEQVDKGDLYRACIRKGLFSSAFRKQYEIYLEYDKMKQTTKRKTSDIVSEVAEFFKVSETQVYRIIKNFKA